MYPDGVKLIWPGPLRGRPRKRYIPDILSRAVEDMLVDAKWHTVSWRNGDQGSIEGPFCPPFGCGSPIDRRSGSRIRANSTFPARRSG